MTINLADSNSVIYTNEKQEKFVQWAMQFKAINLDCILDFIFNCDDDLSLHEIKCLFSEKYQDRIEFSYILQVEKNIFNKEVYFDSLEDEIFHNSNGKFRNSIDLGMEFGFSYPSNYCNNYEDVHGDGIGKYALRNGSSNKYNPEGSNYGKGSPYGSGGAIYVRQTSELGENTIGKDFKEYFKEQFAIYEKEKQNESNS